MSSSAPAASPPPAPSRRFEGRVAIVTGATHGIGFAIALELLREGALLVGSALPADEVEGRASFAAAGFDSVVLVFGDLAEETFVRRLVGEAVRLHGRVDFLVNNAFSFLSKGAGASALDFSRSFSVGPVAFALLISACAEHMPADGHCAVVNVSSISAWIAQPDRWTYNMAKGAVAQLTRCAALDLAPRGIRVNSVSPAWTWTREVDKACGGDRGGGAVAAWAKFHMLRRLAEPVEVARPVLFLLSRDASFITGADLPVDGGYTSLGPEGLGESSAFAGTR